MRPKKYHKTVTVLIFLDLALSAASIFFPAADFFVLRAVAHIGIGVWVGIILNWIARSEWKRWRPWVLGYWFALGLSSFGGGFVPSAVGWMIAFVVVTKCTYVETLSGDESLPAGDVAYAQGIKKPKRTWPLPASVVLFLGVVIVNLVMALADKSEFRGLGLLFLHFFIISPVFLVVPALLRIPSRREVKPAVIGFQYLIYVGLALSWIILLYV